MYCYVSIKNDKLKVTSSTIKKLYQTIIQQKKQTSKAHDKYSEKFDIDESEWENIYLSLKSAHVSNKAKEIQYKILHDYIANNKFLFHIGVRDNQRCNFCNLYNQTTVHLFYECLVVKNFWFSVRDWIQTKGDNSFLVTVKYVIFGSENLSKFANEVVLYGKKFIHNCKYKEIMPYLDPFRNSLTNNFVN